MEKKYEPLTAKEELVAKEIVDAAFRVHSILGPGMLESIYETCFCYELTKRHLRFSRQVYLPVKYDDLNIEQAFRLDVLVEELVVCELKATELVSPVYFAQLLSYLRLTSKRLGFLINFHVPNLKSGIRRIIL